MNDHRARQEQMQKASRAFLQALSAGQVSAVDRFGLKIEPGSKLLYHGAVDVVYDVVSVNPVLDPRVPPGILEIMVTVTFPIRTQANQINPLAVVMPHLRQAPVDAPPTDPPSEGSDAELSEAEKGIAEAGPEPSETPSPIILP
jgi:hypothetical protein